MDVNIFFGIFGNFDNLYKMINRKKTGIQEIPVLKRKYLIL